MKKLNSSKLVLNKRTVSDLTKLEMKDAKGGLAVTVGCETDHCGSSVECSDMTWELCPPHLHTELRLECCIY